MGTTKALSQLLSLLSVFSPCDLAIRGISDCSKANDLCHSLSVSFSLESAVLLPLCREKKLVRWWDQSSDGCICGIST